MSNALKDFGEIATKLAKNPLGIFALFQVLIYGIAGYVTAKINTSNPSLLAPLVWFLIFFPILVIFIFAYLVINHHQKLYAPSDFNDEENFMRSAGIVPHFTAEEMKKNKPLTEDKNVTEKKQGE